MKRKFHLLIALLMGTNIAFAQLDRSNGAGTGGGIEIPAVETSVPLPKKGGMFSNEGLFAKKETPLGFPKKKKEFSMTTDNGLMEYTYENFTPKTFTKDKEAKKEYAKDQYLGDFVTGGNFVELYARDHEYVDGDKVQVIVNGQVVQHSVNLVGGYTPILVKLNSGFNSIEFIALNQGTSGPNTAELRIFDSKGEPLAQKEWNLLTGATARIVVVKQ